MDKKKKEKKGIVAGQKQPLGAVWCKTRLFNSGGQFDQLCNLIGGAILARSTMLAHSRAIIAYGDGRPRSKVCVCVCGKVAEDKKNSSCYSTSLPPEDWRRSVAGDVVVRYGFLRGGWQFGLGLWPPCPG